MPLPGEVPTVQDPLCVIQVAPMAEYPGCIGDTHLTTFPEWVYFKYVGYWAWRKATNGYEYLILTKSPDDSLIAPGTIIKLRMLHELDPDNARYWEYEPWDEETADQL